MSSQTKRQIDPNMPAIDQVWILHVPEARDGERWFVEEMRPFGETSTVKMTAIDGRHAGKSDVVWVGDLRGIASLEIGDDGHPVLWCKACGGPCRDES